MGRTRLRRCAPGPPIRLRRACLGAPVIGRHSAVVTVPSVLVHMSLCASVIPHLYKYGIIFPPGRKRERRSTSGARVMDGSFQPRRHSSDATCRRQGAPRNNLTLVQVWNRFPGPAAAGGGTSGERAAAGYFGATAALPRWRLRKAPDAGRRFHTCTSVESLPRAGSGGGRHLRRAGSDWPLWSRGGTPQVALAEGTGRREMIPHLYKCEIMFRGQEGRASGCLRRAR